MNPELMDPSLDGGARLETSSKRTPVGRIGRIGEPEDFVYTALYLASDESSWLTGQTLVVDGGLVTKGP